MTLLQRSRVAELEARMAEASKLQTHFPLTQAVICAECEAVFQEGSDRCPCCTGGTFIFLTRWIESGQLRREIDETRQRNLRREED